MFYQKSIGIAKCVWVNTILQERRCNEAISTRSYKRGNRLIG
jgi:hypothetical protein